ncbi:hypothetical protein [Sphingopyxis macrogoltabida]|uniref:Spore coat protein U domain-containing protein n=1 Tax=Sphingopyxis macrogoltabida TaxID=33050 RepID=A0AAC9FHK5_SPHMC|nr:hypothetical protein [Sphingopyxis macrogoltabida]ALJ16180.1 hypothetical protein LH19_25160 [Sphingopyxis macrogoltabida]AMU92420.1 hypothetical protein ATM17_25730 [Sphingopyxis macrogoltabida]
MKKLAYLSVAAASAIALASPAAAQTTATGTINITGSVANKCMVVSSGGAASSTFTDSRDLGELAQANGTLESSGVLESRFGTSGSGAPTFRVVCTTAAPVVSVNADPLVNAAAADTGYSNTVNYTATATFALTGGGSTPVANVTTSATDTSATLASRLAASGDNVTITTSLFNTDAAGANALMVAGSYTGKIVVTVSPI